MTYRELSVGQCAVSLLLLAFGAALMVIAERRDWRPRLVVAIATAAALRLVMLSLAYRTQPYDLAHDFYRAGFSVLHHRDPFLHARPTGWNYLPIYGYVLAGAYWAHLSLHVPWLISARVAAILCDLGVVVMVGTVTRAAGGRSALRRFQYACNPLAVLVSAVHGQMEPAALLFSLAAFAVVLRARPPISGRSTVIAGILLGLGIATKTWPVLFGPALLVALPSWRRRWELAAGAGGTTALFFVSMPVTVGTPVAELPHLAKIITGYHPVIGSWGWSGVWVAFHRTSLSVSQDPLWINVGSAGTKLAIVGALLAVWWWRRAHPLDVATATTTALVAITPSFGAQYLLWPVPSRTAYPTRLSTPLHIVLGAYAATFYLPMQMLTSAHWQMANKVMMVVSLMVIALMIAALPWQRRVWHPPREGVPSPTCPGDPAPRGTPAHSSGSEKTQRLGRASAQSKGAGH